MEKEPAEDIPDAAASASENMVELIDFKRAGGAGSDEEDEEVYEYERVD